jgi:hypothetical protein
MSDSPPGFAPQSLETLEFEKPIENLWPGIDRAIASDA